MSELQMDASFFTAFALVCIYATSRFNTPATSRSQTSQFQYYGSCAAYVLSSSGLFIFLTWLLVKNPQTIGFLHFGASEALSGEVTKLATPLIVALAMTTLLPSFPVLRDIDAKLLRLFHRIGSIPIAVAQWSQRMKEAQFVISPNLLAEVQNYISNSSILTDDTVAELRTDPSKDSARY